MTAWISFALPIRSRQNLNNFDFSSILVDFGLIAVLLSEHESVTITSVAKEGQICPEAKKHRVLTKPMLRRWSNRCMRECRRVSTMSLVERSGLDHQMAMHPWRGAGSPKVRRALKHILEILGEHQRGETLSDGEFPVFRRCSRSRSRSRIASANLWSACLSPTWFRGLSSRTGKLDDVDRIQGRQTRLYRRFHNG
jgi:hypothetical protein